MIGIWNIVVPVFKGYLFVKGWQEYIVVQGYFGAKGGGGMGRKDTFTFTDTSIP